MIKLLKKALDPQFKQEVKKQGTIKILIPFYFECIDIDNLVIT